MLPLLGCRRLTMSPTFLPAISSKHVDIVRDPIERIEAEGIRLKTGELRKMDVLIYATGFNTDFVPKFKIVGRKGAVIQEEWSVDAEGYVSPLGSLL